MGVRDRPLARDGRVGAVPDVLSDRPRAALLAHYLAKLGLLSVERLARLQPVGDELPESDLDVRRFLEVTGQRKIERADARRALSTLAQICAALQERYAGKVQCYLREQGSALVDRMCADLPVRGVANEDVRWAYSSWLQCAADMPLPSTTPEVVAYCTRHELRPSDLYAAADRIDLNVGVVDDLVAIAESASRQMSEE